MENACIKTTRFRKLEVTVIITGEVNINGRRAGDKAQYYEIDGKWLFITGFRYRPDYCYCQSPVPKPFY
ncbi:MAG: adenosylcobinamide hydrolase [Clostridia bacterium]|nr:adenosylcobinamide hydrolase [Clostridia bacterium]